jgi:hypothetical protein
MEASHSGLVHRLGKAAYRKVSRVRISPPPPNKVNLYSIKMLLIIVIHRGDKSHLLMCRNEVLRLLENLLKLY